MVQSNIAVNRSSTFAQLVEADAWKRLGLIALSTDLTTERDYRHLLPADGLGLYTTRVAFENPTTPENLKKMTPRLTAAAQLLPDDQRLDAICYSCTAASVVIGDDAVTEAIQVAHPGGASSDAIAECSAGIFRFRCKPYQYTDTVSG